MVVIKAIKFYGLKFRCGGITLVGVVPGIILLNSGNAKLGLACMIVGIALCYAFKKFKRVSEYFLLKSFLIAKKWLPAPAGSPLLLGKIVGK